MIKYLSILFVCLMCGCTATNSDITNDFNMPQELQNYKVICLHNVNMNLYVLVKKDKEDRNVIGTSSSGKIPTHTIVIDDVEYVRKQQ